MSVVLFVILTSLLTRYLKRGKNTFFPLEVLSNKTVSSSLVIGALINFAFYGAIFLITIYFQLYRNYTALETGLALLTFVVIALANSYSSHFRQRLGTKRALNYGLLFSTIGFVLLAYLVFAEASYGFFVAALVLMPLGTGVTLPILISVFLDEVPSNLSATASAAINAARQIGGALGVAVVGGLLASEALGIKGGAELGFILSGLSLLLGVGLVGLYIKKEVDQP